MSVLTGRERKALKHLEISGCDDRGGIGVGEKTIASLLEKGLIVLDKSRSPGAIVWYCITDAGRAARDVAEHPKPAKRKLPMVAPLLKPRSES